MLSIVIDRKFRKSRTDGILFRFSFNHCILIPFLDYKLYTFYFASLKFKVVRDLT